MPVLRTVHYKGQVTIDEVIKTREGWWYNSAVLSSLCLVSLQVCYPSSTI